MKTFKRINTHNTIDHRLYQHSFNLTLLKYLVTQRTIPKIISAHFTYYIVLLFSINTHENAKCKTLSTQIGTWQHISNTAIHYFNWFISLFIWPGSPKAFLQKLIMNNNCTCHRPEGEASLHPLLFCLCLSDQEVKLHFYGNL